MEQEKITKAKVQKTKSIESYWSYYCAKKEQEGWIHNSPKKANIFQSISKGEKIITYMQFSSLLKLYYKKVCNYVIKGYRLRFDYGLGNLRIIKYDGKTLLNANSSVLYKNTKNIDFNIPQCTFYFHRDTIDISRRKHKIENISIYELNIARSNGTNDKSLGFKFKLSYMIRNNPSLIHLYDTKIINHPDMSW